MEKMAAVRIIICLHCEGPAIYTADRSLRCDFPLTPGDYFGNSSGALLMIKGNELHMGHLTLEKGEINVDEVINDSLYVIQNLKKLQAGGKIWGAGFLDK